MLELTSPDFGTNGEIGKDNTGFGDDVSPTLVLSGLSNDAKSLAIIMDDLDVPFVKAFNHWVIWNIPPKSVIEKNIPYGSECPDGSKQGIGYGKIDIEVQNSLHSFIRLIVINLQFVHWILF
ncbi:MAG: YbhB/YbcL family Raf kinase inhibitor-like protein [Spirochaetales bacterium]|nr:YbhB/YbcL family Raf kinase inhibitor-like protein [Spirochaetales bacterium]